MAKQSPTLKEKDKSVLPASLKAGLKQRAVLRFLKMAPRKIRLIADGIRGMSVNDAEAALMLQRRRGAKPLLKLLRSAVAAAKNSKKLDPAKLAIETIQVDKGPILKRYLPRARGSASPIHKIMSHVILVLAEMEGAKNRYKIVPPKKVKLPAEKAKKKDEKEKEKDGSKETAEKPKTGGFFKRRFARKAI